MGSNMRNVARIQLISIMVINKLSYGLETKITLHYKLDVSCSLPPYMSCLHTWGYKQRPYYEEVILVTFYMWDW